MMGRKINRPGEVKEKRRAAEYTALDGKDFSEIAFTVGGWGALMPQLRRLCLYFALFCGWMLVKQWVLRGTMDMTLLLWILVMLLLIAVMFACSVYQRLHAQLQIRGNTAELRGWKYRSSEIEDIRITRSERVKVYAAGKLLVSYSWDEENIEMLLAWAHKCGIQVNDER